MAHIKVFARRTVIVAGFLGFFGAASLCTFHAAGAAIHLGHYSASR